MTLVYAMLHKYNIKSTGNKNENRQVGLHQTEKSSLHPELPTERQCMEEEKIFTNYISDKWLISKKCKEILQFNRKKS